MLNGIKTKNECNCIVWKHPKTEKHHRLDGPAHICDANYRYYFINGKTHNINGPAQILKNDEKYYHIDGKCYGYNNKKHKWLLITLKRKLIQKKKY